MSKISNMLRIRNLKIELYSALLWDIVDPDDMSEEEINIMEALSKDADVQKMLEKAKENARNKGKIQ